MLKIERIYSRPFDLDGYRILIDRKWARGISKADAQIGYWAKSIAPSNDLRTWFDHDDGKFDQFEREYINELDNNPATRPFLNLVNTKLREGNVILLYGAKNTHSDNAVVLIKYLRAKLLINEPPVDSLLTYLYNDGETNRTKKLSGPYQWLNKHPTIFTKLNLRLGANAKIYQMNANRALDHQSLLQLAIKYNL